MVSMRDEKRVGNVFLAKSSVEQSAPKTFEQVKFSNSSKILLILLG